MSKAQEVSVVEVGAMVTNSLRKIFSIKDNLLAQIDNYRDKQMAESDKCADSELPKLSAHK